MDPTTVSWTANQLEVIRDLLGWTDSLEPGPEPPTLSSEVVDGLRSDLERRVKEAAARFDDRPLVLNKYDITTAIKCERLWLSPSEFEWNASNVRGKVVHRAIQISLAGRGVGMSPGELVDAAVKAYAAGDDDLADFFRRSSPAGLSDVVTSSSAAVTAFFSGWPPIRPRMIPRIEAPVHVPLCEGRIVLRGRYDLALGPPGRGPVIVDLKTGEERPEHPEEVRYYGLLETLAQKSPPRRVATYYLDGGWFRMQDINEGVLQAALRRTGEAVNRVADLWWRVRDARHTPGPHCHYCPARPDCPDGLRWIEESRDRGRPRV